jgi:hypothetical protein
VQYSPISISPQLYPKFQSFILATTCYGNELGFEGFSTSPNNLLFYKAMLLSYIEKLPFISLYNIFQLKIFLVVNDFQEDVFFFFFDDWLHSKKWFTKNLENNKRTKFGYKPVCNQFVQPTT